MTMINHAYVFIAEPEIVRTGGVNVFHVKITERKKTMIEPKDYVFNPDVVINVALKAGFELFENNLSYRKVLYRCDDTNVPYVELRILIENMGRTVINVVCNGGDTYFPFVNPELRHDNLVYEKVVTAYHNEMEKLVRKKILKHVKPKHKEKKHGRDN